MSGPSKDDRDLTSLIARFNEGDQHAAESLLPLIYEELRQIASAHFRNQYAGHTLQPTALVNEAYLKLAELSKINVSSRKHFFALAARIMRHILVDHARSKNALKRGGHNHRVTLDGIGEVAMPQVDMLALEDALNRLQEVSPGRAKLVELRFFGGLTSQEAGEVLGVSKAEAARQWRAAKAWLITELGDGDEHEAE